MPNSLAGRNFQRLLRVLPILLDLRSRERRVLVAEGHPDLEIHVLGHRDERLYLSLAHFHPLAGHVLPLPEITVVVDLEAARAEALSLLAGTEFRTACGTGAAAPAGGHRFDLDRYLANWLCLLFIEGHELPSAQRQLELCTKVVDAGDPS
jgi:uncharacterized protein YqiB (DUF1249 family)